MRKQITFALFISTLIVSCNFQSETGGACTYIDFEEMAEIISIDESMVSVKGVDLVYELKHKLFEITPTVGERYLIKSKRLTRGSCNPLEVVLVEKR